MKKVMIFAIILISVIAVIGVLSITGKITMNNNERILIETSKGNIIIELYADKAPITVANFRKYVSEGFYDGTIFHRVIADFMIQGGGFTSERDEKPTHQPIKLESKNGLSNKKGTIAMARTSVPNSATSQFFINTADNNFLDYSSRNDGYTVFGKVIEGMNVVEAIEKTKTGNEDWPLEEILIVKVSFLK